MARARWSRGVPAYHSGPGMRTAKTVSRLSRRATGCHITWRAWRSSAAIPSPPPCWIHSGRLAPGLPERAGEGVPEAARCRRGAAGARTASGTTRSTTSRQLLRQSRGQSHLSRPHAHADHAIASTATAGAACSSPDRRRGKRHVLGQVGVRHAARVHGPARRRLAVVMRRGHPPQEPSLRRAEGGAEHEPP